MATAERVPTDAAAGSVVLRGVTLLPQHRPADVLVTRGRIAAITQPEPGRPARRDVDARGLFVLPGLVEAHVHVAQTACAARRVDLRPAASARDAAALMRAAAAADQAAGEAAETLVGHGFRDSRWPDKPSAGLLDDAVPGRVVVLQSNDLHTVWLNSAALRLLGMDNKTDQLDESRGVLREQACYDAVARLATPASTRVDAWAAQLTTAAAARGVTMIRDFEFADTITDWQRRTHTHQLATRIECVVPWHLLPAAGRAGHRTGDALDAEALLRVGPVKLFVDGSLNSKTAYCDADYPGGGRGRLELDRGQLEDAVRTVKAAGCTPAVHAIGDAAVRLALDAMDAAHVAGRIEHAQLVHADDIPRLARPGLVLGVQPAHAPDDRDIADAYWAGRTARAYPYRDLHAAGARLEFGSDAPNAPLDPWDGVAAAITRTDDDRGPWHPEQALPLAVALTAACGGRSQIRPGEAADLVLLAADPWATPPRELTHMPVAATMVAGRWTYRS